MSQRSTPPFQTAAYGFRDPLYVIPQSPPLIIETHLPLRYYRRVQFYCKLYLYRKEMKQLLPRFNATFSEGRIAEPCRHAELVLFLCYKSQGGFCLVK